jgi:molecular chaperone GrpE (heat shock protein)
MAMLLMGQRARERDMLLLLGDEFTVEEEPVQIYLPEEAGAGDLADLVSSVLVDNDRLRDLTLELKNQKPGSDQTEKILRSLLPTLDSFERILALGRSFPKSDEVDNWLKSVETVYYRLLSTLENYELKQMNSTGQKVNLDIHEVVEYRPSADHANDTVVSERQKGYVFRGKLLRDAKVVVAFNENTGSVAS